MASKCFCNSSCRSDCDQKQLCKCVRLKPISERRRFGNCAPLLIAESCGATRNHFRVSKCNIRSQLNNQSGIKRQERAFKCVRSAQFNWLLLNGSGSYRVGVSLLHRPVCFPIQTQFLAKPNTNHFTNLLRNSIERGVALDTNICASVCLAHKSESGSFWECQAEFGQTSSLREAASGR